MPTDANKNYLAKLLTLLIKRDGGVIKIPIQDLMVDDVGQGFQVHFSQETKELVLTSVPAGSTIYKIEGATTWLSQPLPQSSQSPKAPLSADDLVAKAWVGSAATPTNQEERELSLRPGNPERRNKVVVLTSESMADAETEKRKQQAMREIEDYQSPQPRTVTRSRLMETFSKP